MTCPVRVMYWDSAPDYQPWRDGRGTSCHDNCSLHSPLGATGDSDSQRWWHFRNVHHGHVAIKCYAFVWLARARFYAEPRGKLYKWAELKARLQWQLADPCQFQSPIPSGHFYKIYWGIIAPNKDHNGTSLAHDLLSIFDKDMGIYDAKMLAKFQWNKATLMEGVRHS